MRPLLDPDLASCTDTQMIETGSARAFTTPPSLDEIAVLAERALAAIPAALARHLCGVGIAVEERADDATLDEVGLDSSWDLTGLYRGTPLPARSVDDIARQPDLIFLYRGAILLEWIETGVELFRLVRNVVVHEIAHHFGFSDASIAALEEEMDERDAPDA
jgi:predicted Zn-dependent protease with MMP-like domain